MIQIFINKRVFEVSSAGGLRGGEEQEWMHALIPLWEETPVHAGTGSLCLKPKMFLDDVFSVIRVMSHLYSE